MNAEPNRTTYDPAADALYVSLAPIAPGAVAETREVAPGVFLDFDAEGKLLGMEVLDASARLPAGGIPAQAAK
ncbi:DUF2283 domain-containing protein [Roseomonas sp. OT10]|uniref:DUF2283 domain-containing protein n=1 Tax=Roseomonas cutis TaxID=2897332 RepID=UPI001E3EAC77|nr:DUF2283 domain-containing protein [Roseomonas sp. OT10]UFN49136.1 DUF2283 domain-containing protein [Roseomonas sp. OT10]